MARNYRIRGTREYLYWGLLLLALCLWALRDGWFPTESKVTKYGTWADPLTDEGWRFYVFNRVLAVGAGLGAGVCAILHKFLR